MQAWRVHPKWTSYEVSDNGCVRRIAGGQGAVAGKLLKPRLCSGYLVVWLSPGHKQRGVHQLVLEAFVGTPTDQVCRHLNGDRVDNRLANLRWGTRSENYADSVRHGTAPRGELAGRAILNEKDVASIRASYKPGMVTQRALAKQYGVTHPTIQAIVEGRTWKNV